VAPSKKVIDPVGVPAADVTPAESVTEFETIDGFSDEPTALTVGMARFTVSVTLAVEVV
jgi:hypothetical protein